ncbi:glycosyltransferase [Dechloromonas denitrificans]|uniref:glycosyltransferase n=1 Tax=Dechloromonas denitrificans TaxID=281362 RepID=UPI001CF8AD51|nr:glycosyltransferase [Dechloromonas denitrificans]UCV01930.1 glycosyltransferase [Dechloromonas denitrificans]UCV06264.1 glycosyltransferase [Dechloromonas denitrificans]
MPEARQPHIVVLSSLFPSRIQPGAGLFIRERMFRVGQKLPVSVIAPTPWFPLQGLLRRIKPHFRPGAPAYEKQSGIDVWYPRFFSIPSLLKTLDGLMMALSVLPRMRQLKSEGRLDIIDAHFAYPDGYAASLLAKWLKVPFTITLRGTETRHIQDDRFSRKLLKAIEQAAQVFSVSESLRKLAIAHGANPAKIEVVGNGVDAQRFSPRDRAICRNSLGIPPSAQVLISVGGLVPRKGFHRVIELLPQLVLEFPELIFLIVGGGSAEGNNRPELEQQVKQLKLEKCVKLLGPIQPDELPSALSAADVFVLATSNEGWANVFLEAMACGLPVVTTDVGGNQEVVSNDQLGFVVPFGDGAALAKAIRESLERHWEKQLIRTYAESNSWDDRVTRLCKKFMHISRKPRQTI